MVTTRNYGFGEIIVSRRPRTLREFGRNLLREAWLEMFEPIRDALIERGVLS